MSKNILDFFKSIGQTPRQEQIDTLQEVEKEWDAYNYFGLSLPTGCGKTFIATAIADHCKSAYIVTSTIQLQKQYEESWDEIVNLKGRNNYQCGLNPQFTVDAAPCLLKKELVQTCCSKGICPYYKQKHLAMQSKAMITNPVYLLLSTINGLSDEGFSKRDVLIMDEAHNIEGHLVSIGESVIDPAKLEKLFDIDFSDCIFTNNNEENYHVIKTIFERLKIQLEDLKQELGNSFTASKANNADLQQWAKIFTSLEADKVKLLNKKIYQLERHVQPLTIFYNTHTEENLRTRWIMHKHDALNTLTLTPLTGGFLFKEYFGKLADKFVFLSATLGTKKSFCAELDIDQNDCLWIEKDSPFPSDNSPIAIFPSISLSRDNYDKNIQKLGKIIDQILDEHVGVRGIIHSVNYNIQTAIFTGVSKKNQRRLQCRDMESLRNGVGRMYKNVELLEMHENQKDSVLLSPSMLEGVDLYDDLSVFQIIVKMPWPNLGDIRTKTKMNMDSDWYSNRAWISIVQGCGRSTRHKDDKSITYILDEKFEYFWKKWQWNLPKYFNDRLCSL